MKKQKKPDEAIAIVSLLLNIFVLPGLGTIVAGRTSTGVKQLVLFVVGIPLIFVLIGIPMMIGAWIWGVVTGVQIVRETQ